MFAAPFKSQFTYPDILRAYLDCRRRKRSKIVCVAFETDFERKLEQLLEEINSGAYRIGRTRAFAVLKPKPREIWAAQFRDRIVHHLLYNEIGEYYEKRFIEDSFSCIKGRGTLAASQRLERFCRSATENWKHDAWFLQVDIANFFVSIKRSLLWDIMLKDVGERSIVARLLRQVIFHDPTENPIIKPGTDFSQIPRHKSLWHCPQGNGLPIGNLTSQFMSNVYLDGLDKYVKHVLKARWYVRYVDDAVFISRDRDQLYEWRDKVDAWLKENRLLHIHPNKSIIGPTWQGINFVGRLIKPFRVYPRRMTVSSAKAQLAKLRDNPLDRKAFDSLQSYIGMMRNGQTFNLRSALCTGAEFPLVVGHDREMTKITRLQ